MHLHLCICTSSEVKQFQLVFICTVSELLVKDLRSTTFFKTLFKMYYNYLGVRMVKLFQLFILKVDNFEVTCVAPVGLRKL